MAWTEQELDQLIEAYQNQTSPEQLFATFEAANRLMAACGNNSNLARAALEHFIRRKDDVFNKLKGG